MTNKEAIARIKDHMVIHKINESRAIYITQAFKLAIKSLENEKPYGEWKLVETFNFIDIVCPYCNNVRFPQYAYGFSIEEVKEHLKSEKLPNYCENCGVKLGTDNETHD